MNVGIVRPKVSLNFTISLNCVTQTVHVGMCTDVDKPANCLCLAQTYQFLMLGLEGAGKTTFLYKLRINGFGAQTLGIIWHCRVRQVACVQLLRYKKDDVKKDMKFLKKDEKDPGCP